jgi:type IV pilus assembly protein PilA
MKWMRQQLSRDEGFTLIELMVVVLIIAVLVAIAIPSFLGFRNSAQDRAAQSDLRNTLLAEKAVWTDSGSYSATAADLQAFEPSLVINNADADTDGVYVALHGAVGVCMWQASGSGTYWGIYEHETNGTTYMAEAALADIACDGTATASGATGFPAAP